MRPLRETPRLRSFRQRGNFRKERGVWEIQMGSIRRPAHDLDIDIPLIVVNESIDNT
jgi:hypothetical protein